MSFSGPYLRCLAPPDDLKILSLINKGVCGNHSGADSYHIRSSTPATTDPPCIKTLRNLFKNATATNASSLYRYCLPMSFIRRQALAIHAVGNPLGTTYATHYWGQSHDVHGYQLLHQVCRSRAHVEHFKWKNIIYQLSIPQSIITDNNLHFIGKNLVKFF